MISIIKRDLLSTKRIKCTLSIISIYLIYFFVQNIFIKSLFKGGVEQVFARTIGITYSLLRVLFIDGFLVDRTVSILRGKPLKRSY